MTALYITITYWAQAQFPYIAEWLNIVTIYYEEMCRYKKKKEKIISELIGSDFRFKKAKGKYLNAKIRGNNKMYTHLFICANRNIGAIKKLMK